MSREKGGEMLRTSLSIRESVPIDGGRDISSSCQQEILLD